MGDASSVVVGSTSAKIIISESNRTTLLTFLAFGFRLLDFVVTRLCCCGWWVGDASSVVVGTGAKIIISKPNRTTLLTFITFGFHLLDCVERRAVVVGLLELFVFVELA